MENSFENSNHSAAIAKLSDCWPDLSDNKFQLTESGKTSIQRFLQNLPASEILENMGASFEKIPDNNRIEERFRYFCGICWGQIKGTYYNTKSNKEVL